MAETPEEIGALLRQAQAGDQTTQELAFDCLRQFRRECAVVLAWQRTDGRRMVLEGEDPEVVRQQTEARIEEARTRRLAARSRVEDDSCSAASQMRQH